MLDRAKQKLAANTSCQFASLNLNQKLPFENDSFDRVISMNVLHALENPEKTVREWARVVKHGGLITVVTLRKDFQMPLILKAHAHQHETDDNWRATSLFQWCRLVFKVFGISRMAFQFLFVAIFNKLVDQHIEGFSREEIEKMFMDAGLQIVYSGFIYGDQDLIYVLRKPNMWVRIAKDDEELEACFRLRYKVFVEEFGVADADQTHRSERDEYDARSAQCLVVKDGIAIGTLRLIQGQYSQDFRGLYQPSFAIDFSKALEFSRVAILREHRGDMRIFVQMLAFAHRYARALGYEYFFGTFRVSFYRHFRKAGWHFLFVSEPFMYQNAWKIVAFVSPISQANIDKINSLSETDV
jgi:N-acyl-L-homoserine lactone synthetase/ubiquinone/menaquinone biosynthesis C-methylase UbiE